VDKVPTIHSLSRKSGDDPAMNTPRATHIGPLVAPNVAQSLSGKRETRRRKTRVPRSEIFTARLSIDVTPELHSRINAAAIAEGMTVAQFLRKLLALKIPSKDRQSAGGR
jgi:hypothetical protein